MEISCNIKGVLGSPLAYCCQSPPFLLEKKVNIDNNKLTTIQEHLYKYFPSFEDFSILTRESNESPCVYTIVVYSVFQYCFTSFSILSKTMYEHLISFRSDHESSGFRKLAVNKWICRKNMIIFLINFFQN